MHLKNVLFYFCSISLSDCFEINVLEQPMIKFRKEFDPLNLETADFSVQLKAIQEMARLQEE